MKFVSRGEADHVQDDGAQLPQQEHSHHQSDTGESGDSRIELVEVIKTRKAPDSDGALFHPHGAVRFFQMNMANVLFGVSVLCILYGIALLIGPILGSGRAIGDFLMAYGALTAYECVLFGAVLVLFCWKAIIDDTVSLVALSPVLISACAVALVTLSVTNVTVTLLLGGMMVVLFGSQVAALWRWVHVRQWGWMLPSVGILLAGMFLFPSLVAEGLKADRGLAWMQMMVTHMAWVPAFVTLVFMIVSVWRLPKEDTFEGMALNGIKRRTSNCNSGCDLGKAAGVSVGEARYCFLHSRGMPFVYAGVLLLGYVTCVVAMGYTFSMSIRAKDVLPLILLMSVLCHEHLNRFSFKSWGMRLGGVAIGVGFAFIAELVFRQKLFQFTWSLNTFWYPSLMYGLMAVYFCVTAIMTRDWLRAGVAVVYVTMLLSGFNIAGMPKYANLLAVIAFLSMIFFVAGVCWRHFYCGFMAVSLAAIICWIIPGLEMKAYHIGALFLMLGIFFPLQMPKEMVLLAAAAVCFDVWLHGQGKEKALPIWHALAGLCLYAVVWWRIRMWSLLIPALFLLFLLTWGPFVLVLEFMWAWLKPVVRSIVWLWRFVVQHKGWLLVGGSFVFLAGGMWSSIRKNSAKSLAGKA